MLIVQAPAKVNLGLAVHRRRLDGYHEISTLFLKISLADEVRLTVQPREIVVHCAHPDVPSDARNLVHRAAVALQPSAGLPALSISPFSRAEPVCATLSTPGGKRLRVAHASITVYT